MVCSADGGPDGAAAAGPASPMAPTDNAVVTSNVMMAFFIFPNLFCELNDTTGPPEFRRSYSLRRCGLVVVPCFQH
jgi:hypothetical protein